MPHLASALFESAAGVQFTTVQFKGGGAAATSTIAGDTQVMFATPPTVIGFIKGGRMRALSLTVPQSTPSIPGIPGAAEAGLLLAAAGLGIMVALPTIRATREEAFQDEGG